MGQFKQDSAVSKSQMPSPHPSGTWVLLLLLGGVVGEEVGVVGGGQEGVEPQREENEEVLNTEHDCAQLTPGTSPARFEVAPTVTSAFPEHAMSFSALLAPRLHETREPERVKSTFPSTNTPPPPLRAEFCVTTHCSSNSWLFPDAYTAPPVFVAELPVNTTSVRCAPAHPESATAPPRDAEQLRIVRPTRVRLSMLDAEKPWPCPWQSMMVCAEPCVDLKKKKKR